MTVLPRVRSLSPHSIHWRLMPFSHFTERKRHLPTVIQQRKIDRTQDLKTAASLLEKKRKRKKDTERKWQHDRVRTHIKDVHTTETELGL